ncbi:WAS/WASL-interacting protein family member 1-like isoform X1 [Poecile atricapillus]|uniref:WAS/WASL-interacting protein family member 1-like isoform X1 n=1 Tax=Poecile atricapillus TaxID=48891 RepID=UPI0027384958|nr:WAS/WASL-interacting protein family member 1-like isoform X1 [Poecile atricapillus]
MASRPRAATANGRGGSAHVTGRAAARQRALYIGAGARAAAAAGARRVRPPLPPRPRRAGAAGQRRELPDRPHRRQLWGERAQRGAEAGSAPPAGAAAPRRYRGRGEQAAAPPCPPSPLYSLLPRRRRRNSSDSAALEVARGSGSVTRHACRPRAGGEELSQTGTQRRGAAPDTPSPPRGGSARHRRDPGGDGEEGEDAPGPPFCLAPVAPAGASARPPRPRTLSRPATD